MSVPQMPGIKAEEHLASEFRREVAALMQRQNLSFPGAQPVSFARKHLDELCKQDYFLCEKTDGVRCLLYLTEGDPGTEIQYLIDRKNDYYFISEGPLHFPMPNDVNAFHRATILDGELVNDLMPDGTRRLRYLVFDCIVYESKLLVNRPLDRRIGHYKEFVEKPYLDLCKKFPAQVKNFCFEVKFKDMDKPYALEELFNNKLPNLPHGNDGLVFTCKGTNYVSGTDEHILKWKPAHENSIDFKLELGTFPSIQYEDGSTYEDYDAQPSFFLHVYTGSSRGTHQYSKFGTLTLLPSEWEAMKSLKQQLDGRIIECFRDENGNWRYKAEEDGTPRFRDDKTTANHVSTVHKVLESIEDAVTQDELVQASTKIMRAWKERHPEEQQGQARPSAPPNPQGWSRTNSIPGPSMNGRTNGH